MTLESGPQQSSATHLKKKEKVESATASTRSMKALRVANKSWALIGVLCLTLCAEIIEGKMFTRCQLAKELLRHDFPRSYLSNWVCLVENESGRSTSKVMQLPNQSVSYGLFQINSKNWCKKGRRGGICNIKCEDFLNDEISDDSRCAIQIFNRHGFQAWPGWVSKCRGRVLPDVSRC